MPYTSYRGLTPEDVDALYAYLMTRAPVAVENRANTLAFPFDQRWTLAAWNLLSLPATVAAPDPGRSPCGTGAATSPTPSAIAASATRRAP